MMRAGKIVVVMLGVGLGAFATAAEPARLPPTPTAPAAPVAMEKVEVTARPEVFSNAIDRKVYLVGKDIASVTGSAGDLLQNVPSLQVDVEGGVSLRGDAGVAILVDGKSSAMFERDRAAALEAMPADAIERVEIITNPSARYRPDGTAGIINLVLKRARAPQRSGTLRASLGNDGRSSASLSGAEPRGALELHGRVAVRQDARPRHTVEERSYPAVGGGRSVTRQETREEGRPRSVLVDAGFNFRLGRHTAFEALAGFGARDDLRRTRQAGLARGPDGIATDDYVRERFAPEREREWEFELKFTHGFGGGERELAIELQRQDEAERETDERATTRRSPGSPTDFERTVVRAEQNDLEITVDYVHPLADEAELEAGYAGEIERNDRDSQASALEPATRRWLADPRHSDRFVHDSAVHAFYATYGRPLGRLGLLAGARLEHARDVTDGPAGGGGEGSYTRVYPSLHLAHDVGDAHRLQFSYSHRIDRPDGRDLNPHLDREDPSHLRAGNPALRPENVHSVETGYEFRAGETTLLASVYHRWREDNVTNVTRMIEPGVLLTIPENIGRSRSSGLELGATTRWRRSLGLNFSANLFRHEIDARNLGFAGRRDATAWEAKLNVEWSVNPRLLVQANTSHRARRLTPQGERLPSVVTNLGVRYELGDGRTSLVATVSDVFGTLRDRTVIDTPALQSDITRRRGSQVVHFGIVRHFGPAKRKTGEALPFDDRL